MSEVSIDARAVGQESLSPTMARYFERVWSHGEGHRAFDAEGRSYLDFATGIATTILGHRHPRVTEAVHAQVDRMLHFMGGLGYAAPVSRLAEMLAGTLPDPLDTVFFDSLLDENASSHIALGSAYETVAPEDLDRINRSEIHVDFMIGGEDVAVTGVTADGAEVEILTGGRWAFA